MPQNFEGLPYPWGGDTPAGDLVFLGRPAGHVGIVLDPAAGTMIDAPHARAVIGEESYTGWGDASGFGTFLPPAP